MDYEKLCDRVLELDSKIRFTGVLDSKGDLLVEKNRADTQLLNPDEVKMSIHYTFERWTQFQNLTYRFGKGKASITEFENVTLISLNLDGKLFLLSVEPGTKYTDTITKINAIIADYQK